MISDLCGCTPVVTEEALRTPLLREIYDCLKEAAFTEMELVALGVMLAAKYSYAAGQLEGRGRDGSYLPPPAQIRTCGTTAYGSCLGYVTRSDPQGKGVHFWA